LQEKLFLLGVGNVARWVVAQAQGQFALYGTSRDTAKAERLKQSGIETIVLTSEFLETKSEALRPLLKDAFVLVSFPPDGIGDRKLARVADHLRGLIYVSSTHVYGNRSGLIDECTPIDEDFPAAHARLEAERLWQEKGAVVLRAPALYGPGYGLHMKLKEGGYRLPNEGENYTSRIHLKDLGRIIIAAFQRPLKAGSTYLVGDLKPASQKEVVCWLCARMGLEMPPSVPLDAVSAKQRVNRQISPKKILADLDLKLEFPTYKEGFEQCLEIGDD
jgi:hypothetical protein